MAYWLVHQLNEIAERAREGLEPGTPLFDLLAEEVMELHLSIRGKHADTPAMEWLEIATIAINALCDLPTGDVDYAIQAWIARHYVCKTCGGTKVVTIDGPGSLGYHGPCPACCETSSAI